MDAMTRRQFEEDMNNVRWNTERFARFPGYKKRSHEQVWAHKTQVVSEHLKDIGMNTPEVRRYDAYLQHWRGRYDVWLQQTYDPAQLQVMQGAAATPAQLESLEKTKKLYTEKIDKLEKARENAIGTNHKMLMALYCQKHGLGQAAKVATKMYWRMAALQGVEAANRVLEKLFNDMLKAVVEGKLGMGSF